MPQLGSRSYFAPKNEKSTRNLHDILFDAPFFDALMHGKTGLRSV